MSAAWALLTGLALAACALIWAALGNMAKEETRTRLNRIPMVLLRLATRRVPPHLRKDLATEWNAELDFVLTGTDGLPLTRLLRGIRYSGSLFVSARAMTRELAPLQNIRARELPGFIVYLSILYLPRSAWRPVEFFMNLPRRIARGPGRLVSTHPEPAKRKPT